MDQMPQELICQICSYLPVDDIVSVYNVSSKFRSAAKDFTGIDNKFSYWKLTTTNERGFLATYSGFRFRLLRWIDFDTHFSDLQGGDDCTCRASHDELEANDNAFSGQIRFLLTTIKTLEERAGAKNSGDIHVTISSPVQKVLGDVCLHRDFCHWRTHLLNPHTLPQANSVTSFRLEDGRDAKLDYRIMIDLSSRFLNLKSLHTHIGGGEWDRYSPEPPARFYRSEYDGPRRDTRRDLAKAIMSLPPPASLHTVELDFLPRWVMSEAEEIHHNKAQPNLIGSASMDPFSNSLRILSYPLRHVTLRLQADGSLFWPQDGSIPVWPNLEELFIMFHMVSPSGRWYFEGPRGEGRNLVGYELDQRRQYPPFPPPPGVDADDWDGDDGADTDCCWESDSEDEPLTTNDRVTKSMDYEMKVGDCSYNRGGRTFEDCTWFQFRISPNDDVLGPFLTNFAKAAAHMPRLRNAVLWCPIRWDVGGYDDDDEWEQTAFDYFELPRCLKADSLAWGFTYLKTGSSQTDHKIGQEPSTDRKIWWDVGEWRPNPELHNLFQEIGRKETGEGLREYWELTPWRHTFTCVTPDE